MPRMTPRLPGREWELLTITLLYVGLFGVVAWQRTDPAALSAVLLALELGLPVALGVVAAGLIAGDPMLELLLSVAQPASRTLAERLATLLGYGLLLAVLLLLVADLWDMPLPIDGLAALLIWAAPAALLVGVATMGALLRGRVLDGVVLAVAVGGLCLMSLTLASDCPPDSEQACYVALVSPLMTLFRPHDPVWLANRLLWLGIGGALLLGGLWMVRDEERLLQVAAAEE